jgi:hypothetical protein
MAKLDADRKAAQEDLMAKMEADRAQMAEFMKTLQAYQAKTDAVLPAIQVTETSRKETATVIEPETEVKTMASQGMEAHQEEEKPASLDMKPEAAQQEEVPVEDAEVIPVGEPKEKRRRNQKLAAEHRRQKPNTSTRENCGPQERLAVTHRGRTHRAKMARKTPIDRKMRRRATVARRMRDIFRPNTTRRSTVAWHRRNIFRKSTTQGKCRPRHEFAASRNMTIRAGATRRKVNFEKKYSNRGQMQQYNVGAPFERIAIDVAGPLPLSEHGNRYLLMAMDYFTKWPEAYAIPNLVTNFFCRFGIPRELHSDQGRNFEPHLLHHNHPGQATIGQSVADVPSGPNCELKKNYLEVSHS